MQDNWVDTTVAQLAAIKRRLSRAYAEGELNKVEFDKCFQNLSNAVTIIEGEELAEAEVHRSVDQ